MQALAKASAAQRRALAIGIALALLVVVYLLGVHWWFTARHLEIAGQMSTLRDKESDYRRIAGGREELEKRLADAHTLEASNPAFLTEGDVDSAVAGLTTRMTTVMKAHQHDAQSCTVISNQPVKAPNKDLFEKVSIRLRLRCTLEEFAPMLHELEGGSPMLFVDEVQIWKQIGYVQPGTNKTSSYLDIQFTLSGYLRKRAPKENST